MDLAAACLLAFTVAWLPLPVRCLCLAAGVRSSSQLEIVPCLWSMSSPPTAPRSSGGCQLWTSPPLRLWVGIPRALQIPAPCSSAPAVTAGIGGVKRAAAFVEAAPLLRSAPQGLPPIRGVIPSLVAADPADAHRVRAPASWVWLHVRCFRHVHVMSAVSPAPTVAASRKAKAKETLRRPERRAAAAEPGGLCRRPPQRAHSRSSAQIQANLGLRSLGWLAGRSSPVARPSSRASSVVRRPFSSSSSTCVARLFR